MVGVAEPIIDESSEGFLGTRTVGVQLGYQGTTTEENGDPVEWNRRG
jgi:hypothetical protein